MKVAGVASICKFSCISQKIHSRDFSSRKVRRMRRKVFKMQYRNQQLKVFEEWKQNRLVKSCSLEAGGRFTTKDLEELWTRPLQICLHAVSTTGCRSSFKVSSSSGERYPSRSLYSIICGLKRYLSDVNGIAALNPLQMSYRR